MYKKVRTMKTGTWVNHCAHSTPLIATEIRCVSSRLFVSLNGSARWLDLCEHVEVNTVFKRGIFHVR